MSDPKQQKETMSLIDDLERSPGYVEWYVPTINRMITDLENEICDVATDPVATATKKIERAVLLSILRLPGELRSGCASNLKVFVDKAHRVPAEA
jgi:hypothetical protein